MRDRPFQPCVYLMASDRNGTLYCGVTSDLVRRIWEHREGHGSRFAGKYNVLRLVWFEHHATMDAAILREKADQEVEPGLEAAAD